jgi:alpha-galactosidase
MKFAAYSRGGTAVLSYRWDFGDGVTLEGSEVNHAYTEPAEYSVHLTATGFSGLSAEDHFQLRISGHMPTTFDPRASSATNRSGEAYLRHCGIRRLVPG